MSLIRSLTGAYFGFPWKEVWCFALSYMAVFFVFWTLKYRNSHKSQLIGHWLVQGTKFCLPGIA